MTCLLDVNLLMALLWENHEHQVSTFIAIWPADQPE